MLGREKFQAVSELRLSAVSEEILEATLNHKGLKKLIISRDFKGFSTAEESRLFCNVLCNIEC